MKAQSAYSVLALSLSMASVALGQALPTQTFEPQPLPRGMSNGTQGHPTAKQMSNLMRASELAYMAATSLHNGDYAYAVVQARQSLSIDANSAGVSKEVLAAALAAQGKDKEALEAYRDVVEHYDTHPRSLLPLAQLLLKSGQWTQALALYNRVLPNLPDVGPHLEAVVVHDSDAMQASSHFSAAAPDPVGLATAIHIARGLVYNSTSGWAGASQDTEAMAEYAKAFQLAPNNALTNYYYGVGWQKLAPAERAKFGDAQQAKAALEKAVKLGKPDVKAAAQKALLVAAKP